MQEIAPSLWHWTARHEHIGTLVSSYYLLEERVLVDPILPAEGLDWFVSHGAPEHALLTNRHHDRHAWRLRDAFGLTVHCPRAGLRELEGRGPVTPYDAGDELPGGVAAFTVGSLCPDESALYVADKRALACADGVVRWSTRGPLAFVPDELMDDPELTRAGLAQAYRGLLELDFDTLLLAHGEPVVGGGREALRAFAQVGELTLGAMRHRRHYTVDEARAQLPWLAAQLVTMRRAQARLADRQARAELADVAPGNGGGGAGKGVGDAFLALQTAGAALDEREIVLRDLTRGLVDFPAIREGREVYLCWLDGESDIGFWHDLDAGFPGRMPL